MLSIDAVIFLTSVLEYLTAEICELSGNFWVGYDPMSDDSEIEMSLENVRDGVQADPELLNLLAAFDFDAPPSC